MKPVAPTASPSKGVNVTATSAGTARPDADTGVIIGSVIGVVLFLACVCLVGNYFVVEFKQQSAVDKWNAYSSAATDHSRATHRPEADIETQNLDDLYGERDSHAEFEKSVFSPLQSKPPTEGDRGERNPHSKASRRASGLGTTPPPAEAVEMTKHITVTHEGGNKFVNNPLLSNPALLQRSPSGSERTVLNDNSRAPHMPFGAAETGRSRTSNTSSDLIARKALTRSSVVGPGTRGYVQGDY